MEQMASKSCLRVAAVQVKSEPGRIKENHRKATPFVEEAARKGAELVAFPELFSPGYIPSSQIWDYAEDVHGPTVTWLKQWSQRLGIYMGAGFLERANNDFFNSYALVDAQGNLAGVVRKYAAESYCFRKGQGEHVVPTPFGRIGVGICADNHLVAFLKKMRQNEVDLMLMPHASPAPYRTSQIISPEDILNAKRNIDGVTRLYTRILGVPIIFVNPVGELQPMSGLLGKLMTPDYFCLAGGSRVIDGDGTLTGELGCEETVLVTDVSLGVRLIQQKEIPSYHGWLHPGSFLLRKFLMPLDDAMGGLSYRLNKRRKSRVSP